MDGGLEEDEDAIDLVDRIPDMPIRDGHTVADFVVCAYLTSDYSPAHPCPPLPSWESRGEQESGLKWIMRKAI